MGGEQYLESGCNLKRKQKRCAVRLEMGERKREETRTTLKRWPESLEVKFTLTEVGKRSGFVGVVQELDFDIVNISFC